MYSELLPQGPFRGEMDLVLASKSPRRQALLSLLGLNFYVLPSKIKEPPPKPGQNPEQYATYLAGLKAEDVCQQRPDSLILAADTIVVLNGDILGKPRSETQAIEMLKNLSGQTHEVITAVVLVHKQKQINISFACKSFVTMAKFSEEVLKSYVQTKEPLDKAGAYGIQGVGAFLVQRINGSYTNVVGLPLTELVEHLEKVGAIRLASDISQNQR
ncbi:septum formation protein Maf [Desulfohalobiaceae bacterium Ax17]|uniref:Maf family protein n=1 Tax=Desulfovulcanus ferrireducens TaxID=2831190 RepID=UPI00207BA212|nr:Maf family protein [Desulfovulcanus ferrireducens]MBT8763920.1 septum formation protein Maf [Desulfovulcanus ferrireducens]